MYSLGMSFDVDTKMLQFDIDCVAYGPGLIDPGAYDFGTEGRIYGVSERQLWAGSDSLDALVG